MGYEAINLKSLSKFGILPGVLFRVIILAVDKI